MRQEKTKSHRILFAIKVLLNISLAFHSLSKLLPQQSKTAKLAKDIAYFSQMTSSSYLSDRPQSHMMQHFRVVLSFYYSLFSCLSRHYMSLFVISHLWKFLIIPPSHNTSTYLTRRMQCIVGERERPNLLCWVCKNTYKSLQPTTRQDAIMPHSLKGQRVHMPRRRFT